jgi:hypothetical protein
MDRIDTDTLLGDRGVKPLYSFYPCTIVCSVVLPDRFFEPRQELDHGSHGSTQMHASAGGHGGPPSRKLVGIGVKLLLQFFIRGHTCDPWQCSMECFQGCRAGGNAFMLGR